MPKYAKDSAWSDIEPLSQDDGGSFALATIAYTEAYSEAMAYLRAVIAKNEVSERVLNLTEDVISMNPAHYTVWLYRAKTLFALGKDLREELDWLNPISLAHLKNYQIWHHRRTLIEKLGSPAGEADFLAQMFEQDAKNYHVWSYRQWLVQHFSLWDTGELEAVETLLKKDIRNNSAWSHRWFVVFGRDQSTFEDKTIVGREIEYAKSSIRLAPQNQSPWNYLQGILRSAKIPALSEKEFVQEFASLKKPEAIRSSHALDMLAGILDAESHKPDEAIEALDLLATKYDPIRANYWNYRKSVLQSEGTRAVAT